MQVGEEKDLAEGKLEINDPIEIKKFENSEIILKIY